MDPEPPVEEEDDTVSSNDLTALLPSIVPPPPLVFSVRRRTGAASSVTGTPGIGELANVRLERVEPGDRIWFRVKGPDTDDRVRARVADDSSASQGVLLTRQGKYVIGFEVNGRLVGEIEFTI